MHRLRDRPLRRRPRGVGAPARVVAALAAGRAVQAQVDGEALGLGPIERAVDDALARADVRRAREPVGVAESPMNVRASEFVFSPASAPEYDGDAGPRAGKRYSQLRAM